MDGTDLSVLFLSVNLSKDEFKIWKELIFIFGKQSGYSLFINNGIKYTKEDLYQFYEITNELLDSVDETIMVKNEKRVAILQMRGFRDEDVKNLAKQFESIVKKYDIEALLVDERTNVETMNKFCNRMEKDIGIYERKAGNKESKQTNTDLRYYKGLYEVLRISPITKKKATYKILEAFDEYKIGDEVKLATPLCRKQKK